MITCHYLSTLGLRQQAFYKTPGDSNVSQLYEPSLYCDFFFLILHMPLFIKPFSFWVKRQHWYQYNALVTQYIQRIHIHIWQQDHAKYNFFLVKINLPWPKWRNKRSRNKNYTCALCGQEFLHSISSPNFKWATMTHVIHSLPWI